MNPLIDFLIQTRLSNLGQNGVSIEDDEPFFVADFGQVIRQHRRWKRNMPDIHPFYGTFSFEKHHRYADINMMVYFLQP